MFIKKIFVFLLIFAVFSSVNNGLARTPKKINKKSHTVANKAHRSLNKPLSKQKISKKKLAAKPKRKPVIKSRSKSTAHKRPNKVVAVKSKKVHHKIPKVEPVTATFSVVRDSILSPGVRYKNIYMKTGRNKFSLHVLEADLTVPSTKIVVMKAQEQISELQKLHDMINLYDTLNNINVLGAVNGNFWRAYSNNPIGPNIVDGEVVELNTYKFWSSGFFDRNGRLYIDNFFMNGVVTKGEHPLFILDAVNRRRDSTGVILYNRFGGDSIPYVNSRNFEYEYRDALDVALNDKQYQDSTDFDFDSLSLKHELMSSMRFSSIEHALPKILLKYTQPPGINDDVPCVIIGKTDSGTVAVPDGGCVLSLGIDIPHLSYKIGDTLMIKFSTNVNKNVVFQNAVSGTPRLVRNGLAKHEAIREGSHGRRFISRQLPRTAIGTNKSQSIVYFVVVESSARSERRVGASLQQMAVIMKRLGAYNAMNLDGGGSSIMVINNKNLLLRTRPEASRRLSVGLGVATAKQVMKNVFGRGG